MASKPLVEPKVKPHISPSQLTMYFKCGEQYRRRYIQKEVIPPGISLIKGTSLHKGAEFNFKQKIKSKVDLPKKDVLDQTMSTFDLTMKHEGLLLKEEEEKRGKAVVIDEAKKSVQVFATLYSDGVAPRYQPVLVEQRQRIELENSPYDLLGVVDMVDDKEKVVDLKTGTKTKKQEDVDADSQLTFYAMTHRAITGRDPSGLAIEQMLDQKVPTVKTFETKRGMEDYRRLINRINAAVDGINKGSYPPAHEGAWWCSAKFCGYHATCPYVKK